MKLLTTHYKRTLISLNLVIQKHAITSIESHLVTISIINLSRNLGFNPSLNPG